MKFGRKISTDLYVEWRPFYLDYNRLKRELKARTTSRAWNRSDELEFIAMLESELDKIYDFQVTKTSELSRRIRDAEKQVKQLVTASDNAQGEPQVSPLHSREATDAEAQQQHYDNVSDRGSDDDDTDIEDHYDPSLASLEDRFHVLEEEVANLVADVHDLALYTKLNITGFMKILKKHDKQTTMSLKPTFVQNYLEKRPFYKYNWDALIVKLSKLYDLVRTRGHPVQGDSSAGANQSAFVRQTTKYWVHPDNLVPLKLAILRNLPVLVFNSDKEFELKDAAITSIYFDNPELDLYLGRLEKTEGAEAVRLRWYGDTDVKNIFVERKTHREDWTGEKSVKARFPIKEHLVNAFLRGEYTMDEEFRQLVKKGKKTQQEVDSMIQLANEVQYAILTRNLRPVVRTFYNRTAFQLPGDARVRISLDTELTMVREDNWDGKMRSGDNWRRTDLGIDWPFEQISAQDKELFKYGVLEVKLQTQFGQEPPQWVTDLVQSHLVEAVPKFSKFIHGCATLLPNRVDLVPFWLPQMDVDILKPSTGYHTVERPSQHASSKATPDSRPSPEAVTPDEAKMVYVEPVSEGEEEDDMAIAPSKDETARTGLKGDAVAAAEAIAFRERTLKDRAEAANTRGAENDKNGQASSHEAEQESDDRLGTEPKLPKPRSTSKAPDKPRALSIDPLASSSTFDETFRERLQAIQQDRQKAADAVANGVHAANQGDGQEAEGSTSAVPPADDRELVRHWVAPPGKRIVVPVRVEPKVYFAAERTFLKWLNISVVIGTIATAMLNFLPPEDLRGFISAGVFTLIALVAILYAASVFVYRIHRLRARRAEGLYYDKYGPTVLSLAMVAAVSTNIAFRLVEIIRNET